MESGDTPFAGVTDMVTQSFEQTRKAMENYVDMFKNMMTSPWAVGSAELNKKMQSYTEQNIAAASDFAKKLTQAKDFMDFWRIQTEFSQAQWKAFGEQVNDLREMAMKGSMGWTKNISS